MPAQRWNAAATSAVATSDGQYTPEPGPGGGEHRADRHHDADIANGDETASTASTMARLRMTSMSYSRYRRIAIPTLTKTRM